jgi:hypothetical protein
MTQWAADFDHLQRKEIIELPLGSGLAASPLHRI